MTRLVQPSLTAGEMSPALYARVDTARYAVGLKRCRNFIVRPYGGVENRGGFRYVGESFSKVLTTWRLIPFVYSTEIAYTVELGSGYAAFYANRAPLRALIGDLSAWSSTKKYAKFDMVSYNGRIWRATGANVNQQPTDASGHWDNDSRIQVVTPFVGDEVWGVRYTQSADVLYLVHPNHPPQELRRLTANSFTLVPYDNTEGPFRDLNTDEGATVAVSAVIGEITITANAPIFTVGCVGSLLYAEMKDLGQIKPWVVGDRGVTVGTLRRSDGKTYKATTVSAGGTWTETGNRQPVHDEGRAWDGSGDTRTNGTQTWAVGVEWEYQDSGYGIAKITGRTDDYTVTAVVQKQFPVALVGVAPTPSATWSFVGTGAKTYSVAGAVGDRYEVTIDGVIINSNPYREPPPATGGPGGGGGGNIGSGPAGTHASIP